MSSRCLRENLELAAIPIILSMQLPRETLKAPMPIADILNVSDGGDRTSEYLASTCQEDGQK